MLQRAGKLSVRCGHIFIIMRYQSIGHGNQWAAQRENLMKLRVLRCIIRLATAVGIVGLIGGAGAQESLDRGKSPAQLFASDCSACHKSPQGLAKAGGFFGLDSFLRSHYTSSRETATAIANYVKSVDTGSRRATRRSARGDEKVVPADRKKPSAKPGEAKGTGKKPDSEIGRSSESKPPDPRPSDARPTGILAPEPKSTVSRPSAPAAGE